MLPAVYWGIQQNESQPWLLLKAGTPTRSTRSSGSASTKRKRPAAKPVQKPARKPIRAATSGGLYPPVKPYNSGMLRVSPVHEIYYEESGNPRGKPAVFLHGGPGGGTDPSMRRFFDPKRYRIVLLDQRGCGRSRPYDNLVDNTTLAPGGRHRECPQALGHRPLAGIRAAPGAPRWRWPTRKRIPSVSTEMVLRGIFLLRRWELDWFYQNSGGAAALFPDLWERYIAPIPEAERHDMIRAYYQRLTSPDRKVLVAAATRVVDVGRRHEPPAPEPGLRRKVRGRRRVCGGVRRASNVITSSTAGSCARTTSCWRTSRAFATYPAVIVQGRYDVVCPMRSAWDLHRAWPEAQLRIVGDAGHSAFEPGNTRELVAATDSFVQARTKRT